MIYNKLISIRKKTACNEEGGYCVTDLFTYVIPILEAKDHGCLGPMRASILSCFGSPLRPRQEACWLCEQEGADEAGDDFVRKVRVEGDK